MLEQTTPETLRERFRPKEMTRADVYPGVIWERDGDQALSYVLDYYKKLVAFYKRAAERGQADRAGGADKNRNRNRRFLENS